MRFRLLALLVCPLLVASSAMGRLERVRHADAGVWDAALSASHERAPAASVRTLFRAVAARPAADRHGPPGSDGDFLWLDRARQSLAFALAKSEVATGAISDCRARSLAFPYNATAPPAQT
jgi:hypothetical protein